MNTSGVPPIRLLSNIDCTIVIVMVQLLESLITHLLILLKKGISTQDLYTWSPDTSDPNPQYNCRAVFSTGTFSGGGGSTFLSTVLSTSVTG